MQEGFNTFPTWEDEVIIRRNWLTDKWGKAKGFFRECPSCINAVPVLGSPSNCKCYFKTKIIENDKMCCIR